MTLLILQERGDEKPARLRKSGIVPMGLVEKGKPTRKVQAKVGDVRYALSHCEGAGMIQVQMDGESKKRKVLVKQIDLEARSGQILTLTLAELTKGESLIVDVAVVTTGLPEPLDLGTGVLVTPTTHIKLKGEIDALPGSIEVDISGLQIGDSISAGSIELPAGTELASSADATLASVQILRAAVESTTDEGESDAAGTEESAEEES